MPPTQGKIAGIGGGGAEGGSSPNMDERKDELIMEKKLRACRVNIIPKTGGYFREGSLPPVVSKKLAPPPVSPKAVEKASNPIALRYWNQCTNSEAAAEIRQAKSMDPIPTPSPEPLPPKLKKVESRNFDTSQLKVPDITRKVGSNPNLHVTKPGNKTEVIKILSTAGHGIKRNNEVKEALGNINRFITVDKMKQEDSARIDRDIGGKGFEREQVERLSVNEDTTISYHSVKQEEMQRSRQRAKFMTNSENIRLPKSPRPFRELSLPRDDYGQNCIKCRKISAPSNFTTKDSGAVLFSDLKSNMVPKLCQSERTELCLSLFSQLPQSMVDEVMAQQLSSMPGARLAKVVSCADNKAVNTAVPLLFPRTNDDVKMSLIAETLPNISMKEKLNLLAESEQEIECIVKGLMSLLAPLSKNRILLSLLDSDPHDDPVSTGNDNHPSASLPEIRIEDTEESSSGAEDEFFGWEKAEDLEGDVYEQVVGL